MAEVRIPISHHSDQLELQELNDDDDADNCNILDASNEQK